MSYLGIYLICIHRNKWKSLYNLATAEVFSTWQSKNILKEKTDRIEYIKLLSCLITKNFVHKKVIKKVNTYKI